MMNRLLYDECFDENAKTKKLADLDQKKIMDLIEQGAEPIYFDITGKIALHTIAEAGLINKLPEDKFNAWKELFNCSLGCQQQHQVHCSALQLHWSVHSWHLTLIPCYSLFGTFLCSD